MVPHAITGMTTVLHLPKLSQWSYDVFEFSAKSSKATNSLEKLLNLMICAVKLI